MPWQPQWLTVACTWHPDKLLGKAWMVLVCQGFRAIWGCITGSCLGSHNGSQWHAHDTLTSCWEKREWFWCARDSGRFGAVSLVHALAATMAHSGMHMTPWQAVGKSVNGFGVPGIEGDLGLYYNWFMPWQHCVCVSSGTHLAPQQAVGERLNGFGVLERDLGWVGTGSLVHALATSCLCLQWCTHYTLTVC